MKIVGKLELKKTLPHEEAGSGDRSVELNHVFLGKAQFVCKLGF
ncbi:MAG: hypothetical protein ACI9S8_001798 [Chlamydiales bacterium]|jgi:hypothetical protein